MSGEKYGRNKKKCERYAAMGTREQNKQRRVARDAKRAGGDSRPSRPGAWQAKTLGMSCKCFNCLRARGITAPLAAPQQHRQDFMGKKTYRTGGLSQ